MSWLFAAKVCSCAKLRLTPPTVTLAMPSVADTVKVPPVVSLVSAAEVRPFS
ncbi:hypothetical protein D3C85_1053330 [compost metagenome]